MPTKQARRSTSYARGETRCCRYDSYIAGARNKTAAATKPPPVRSSYLPTYLPAAANDKRSQQASK